MRRHRRTAPATHNRRAAAPPSGSARALPERRRKRACGLQVIGTSQYQRVGHLRCKTAWNVVADSLCDGRLTFGGRDCTPHNVLTDGAQVWFLDFAVIGLDWPEARLAQYAAFVGASTPGALPQSLLTFGGERWYVESGCIESTQLDMHHLLLWSEAARLLLDGKLGTLASPGHIAGRETAARSTTGALSPHAQVSRRAGPVVVDHSV